MTVPYPSLNADKALIWRICHRDNIPWLLDHGMHCRNSGTHDPHFVNIGNVELINKRTHRVVPIAPGGTLSDYVPFYFTPFSPMMYNIKTGYGGIRRRDNEEIIILVSSLHKIAAAGLQFVSTDRHAYPQLAQYYNDLAALSSAIDWDLLQRRDFQRDPDDPVKVERYQAEALIRGAVPTSALIAIICYNEHVKASIDGEMAARGLTLEVLPRTQWYFQ